MMDAWIEEYNIIGWATATARENGQKKAKSLM
jgi:hypothetical protein